MKDKEGVEFEVLNLEIEETGVLVSTTQGKSCFLAYDEFISDWVAEGKCRGDAHIATAYDEEVKAVREFFTNAKNYKITCSLRGEKVVGYSFTGHTVIDGEKSFVHRAKAFDLSLYPEPEPPKPPGAIKKVVIKTLKVLDKIFRGY